ncbi:eCIS core domain-containing protein [Sphaerotilaceae bacterium SBD11-9]
MTQAASHSHDPHAKGDPAASRQPGAPTLAPTPALVLQALGGNQGVGHLLGAGRPLPDEVRREFEARFRHSFADVRLHTGPIAAQAAGAMDAGALTAGRDIVFGAHAFAPERREGRWLLAHELAHVVQQQRGGTPPPVDRGAPHEADADRAADAAVGGQGPVQVAAATGVGVACGPGDWLKSKYRSLRDEIPVEYREKAAEYATSAAKTVTSTALSPLVPTVVTEAATDRLLTGDVSLPKVDGNKLWEDVKGEGRDQLLGGLGTVSGVAKQFTEVGDTFMWLGTEARDLRTRVAGWGGEQGSFGNQVAGSAFDSVLDALPGDTGKALTGLAQTADLVKSLGWVDTNVPPGQEPKASLTAPFAKWIDEKAGTIEEAVGGTPADPLLFSRLEMKEIEAAIGTQGVLALTGTEEVKIALNVVGALQSLRGFVEAIRRNPNGWYGDPQFWGGVIGVALSLVGLKHAKAATKFTTLLMRFGWTAQAVPLLLQMKDAYFDDSVPEEVREQRVKAFWAQAIHVVKDGILHVAQAQGAKPGAKGGGSGDDAGDTPPPTAKPPIADEGGDTPPKVASPAAEADTGTPTTAVPSAKTGSGIELDTGDGQPWRGKQTSNFNEFDDIDLPPAPAGSAPLELDTGTGQPWRGQAPAGREVDLGPLPPGKLPDIYEGKKWSTKIPGVKRSPTTFGEASDEKAGTFKRTGMDFNSLNAAEIDQGLRVDYDPVAGRPRSVSYRVDADTSSRAVQTDRTFRRDPTTQGAQSVDDDYTNTGYDRGHLAQREAFKGNVDVELAADQMTNVVPMHPDLNRGAGSPWRAAESRTITYASKYGQVRVLVEPKYDANPQRLPNKAPIPTTIRRTVIAPDGTVLEDITFNNAAGQAALKPTVTVAPQP